MVCTSHNPVHSLPNELLTDIFELSAGSPELDESITARGSTAPWYLGQICGHWRDIAIHTFSLWATIIIQDPQRQRPAQLVEQLRRTGKAPLQVCFVSLEEAHPAEPQSEGARAEANFLLRLLIMQSTRWTQATLFLSNEDFVVMASVQGRLNKLYYLHIRVGEGQPVVTQVARGTEPFLIAPLLRTVVFDCTGGLRRRPAVPLALLTEIEGMWNSSFHLEVLANTPALEKACLWFGVDPAYGHEPTSVVLSRSNPLALNSLRTLRISDLSFLDFVSLPALDSLSVGRLASPETYISMARRSSASPRDLQIEAFTLDTPRALELILAATPSVIFLAFVLSGSDPAAGAFITALGKAGPLGPKVVHLHIEVGEDYHQDDELFTMIDYRARQPRTQNACMPLRTVSLVGQFFTAAMYQRLAQLQAAIATLVEVRVTTPSSDHTYEGHSVIPSPLCHS
ncbi:hypothetical protein C8R47DRAFT_1084957 [Mycena vitilis]|nr:hypothetical protein C8R47DRAFT_1084957 [Mycena vitilis]